MLLDIIIVIKSIMDISLLNAHLVKTEKKLIRKHLDDQIVIWNKGKQKKTDKKDEDDKWIYRDETTVEINHRRNKKKKLYKDFEKDHNQLYNYLKENIKKYKEYDVILLFMTREFILLITRLNSIGSYNFIELIKILSTKQLITVVEQGNQRTGKKPEDLYQSYNCIDYNKHNGIECVCSEPHIINLFFFIKVIDNETVIFGSDCIWRIESIIYLLKDKETKQQFIEKISIQRPIYNDQIKAYKRLKEKEKKEKKKKEAKEKKEKEEKEAKEKEEREKKEWFKRYPLKTHICGYMKENKCVNKNNYKKYFVEPKYKICYDCRDKYYKKCSRCNKPSIEPKYKSKYKYCFKCNLEEKEEKERKEEDEQCPACHNTGISYWSDGVYGDCMECN